MDKMLRLQRDTCIYYFCDTIDSAKFGYQASRFRDFERK